MGRRQQVGLLQARELNSPRGFWQGPLPEVCFLLIIPVSLVKKTTVLAAEMLQVFPSHAGLAPRSPPPILGFQFSKMEAPEALALGNGSTRADALSAPAWGGGGHVVGFLLSW